MHPSALATLLELRNGVYAAEAEQAHVATGQRVPAAGAAGQDGLLGLEPGLVGDARLPHKALERQRGVAEVAPDEEPGADVLGRVLGLGGAPGSTRAASNANDSSCSFAAISAAATAAAASNRAFRAPISFFAAPFSNAVFAFRSVSSFSAAFRAVSAWWKWKCATNSA